MITLKRLALTASVFTLSMSALACSESVTPPKTIHAQTDVEAPAPQGEKPDDGQSGSIVVDQEIARQCDLPTAQFAFDHSNVRTESSEGLNALALCLASGALKGRALTLVGHADPRGELEYNFALGQRRAGSVEAYLIGRGLDDKNMETSSRGELEATGEDATGWARDRKVEIFLAHN